MLGAKPVYFHICTIGVFRVFVQLCLGIRWLPPGVQACGGQGTEARRDCSLSSAPRLRGDHRQSQPPILRAQAHGTRAVPSHALALICLGFSQSCSPSLIPCHPADESHPVLGQGLQGHYTQAQSLWPWLHSPHRPAYLHAGLWDSATGR